MDGSSALNHKNVNLGLMVEKMLAQFLFPYCEFENTTPGNACLHTKQEC